MGFNFIQFRKIFSTGIKISILTTLLAFSQNVSAQIVFVDQTASGTSDGASWANAMTDLQTAIDAAAGVASVSNPIQVWVKSGTYFTTSGTDRTIGFELKDNVEVYGGFDGSESMLSQRDPEVNATILSGDIGTTSDNTDNAYGVVYAGNNVSNTTVIDGFHITGASTLNEGTGTITHGGVSLVGSAAKLEVMNCLIYGNDAGFGSAITTVFSTNASAILIVAFSKVYDNSRSITTTNTIWTTTDFEIYNSLVYDNGGQNVLLRQIGNVVLSGVTFFNNSGNANFQNQPSNTSAQIYNSIFWKSGLSVPAVATTVANNNLVEGGFGLGTVIDADPQFFDESTFDLRITHCSPAVNAGDNFDVYAGSSLDLNGDPRIFGSTVDLGAYESQLAPLILATATVTNVLCSGDASGQISVVGSGGSGALTYSIDGTNFVSSGTFSNLGAGAYTAYVKDATCTYSEMFTIAEPSVITIDLSVIIGASSNSLEVTAAGGTGALQYSLDGTNYQTANSFVMASSGQYKVYVKDANNCVVTKSAYFSSEGNQILFVDKDATGNADGSFWTDAYTDVQVAIDIAELSATEPLPVEIWVAEGIYYPTIGTDRDASFSMRNNVEIYGGFDGTETLLSQRNYIANASVLSGNIGDPNDSTDNSRHVILNVGTAALTINKTAVLDGVTVEEGFFSGGTIFADGGAGMKNSYASPTVRNTIFRANVNGRLPVDPGFGGFNGIGGAVRNDLLSTPDFISCVFSHNVANQGGALAFLDLAFTSTSEESNVINCLFYENEAVSSGSAFYGSQSYTINIQNNTFAHNAETGAGSSSATSFGFYSGALIYRVDGRSPKIENNIFWGNTSPAGDDQLWLRGSNAVIFDRNVVEGGNQGIRIDDVGTLTKTNLFDFDPQFIDPSFPNYTLNYCSQAVDAGTDENLPADVIVDFIGNPRIFNEVDLGAFEVQDQAPYVVSFQVDSTTCFAGTDGQITVNASGTFTPISYSTDGTTFGATNIFTGLAAGDHSIYFKDANDCLDSAQFTVLEPAMLALSASVDQNVSCNGAQDGFVTGTVTGGTEPYQISLDGGSSFATSPFTGSIFELAGLDAVAHTLTVIDAKGCSFTMTQTVDVTQPAVLDGTLVAVSVSCEGGADGSLTVTASGGTSPFTYSLDGTNFQSGNEFLSLSADDYTVTIRDANDCEVELSPETVSEPSALSTIAVSATNVSCFGGSDGSFAFGGSGGTPPYQYSLDGVNFQASELWENLEADVYTLTIKDANDCTIAANWTVTEPDQLAASLTATGTSSCGLSDGSIEVTPAGGTAPYTFVLDGGTPQSGTTITFSGLAAGSYSIAIEDANGCDIAVTEAVEDPVSSIVSATTTDILCNGDATGAINLTVTGGATPIEYSLNSGAFQSGSTFESLIAGNYNITVREANGCTQNVNATINEPAALVGSATTTGLSCFEAGDGVVAITVVGGVLPYEYSIDGVNFQSASDFENLDAGAYELTVRDSNDCTDLINVTIDQPLEVTASATALDASCTGSLNGRLTIAVSNGVSPISYSLDGGTSQGSNVFDLLDPGTYSVEVMDASGCGLVLTDLVVGAVTTIIPSLTTVPVSCFGESTGEVSVSATGGIEPYEYSIDGTTFQSGVDFSGLAAATYTITVRDSKGCTGTQTASVAEPDLLALAISSQTDVACNGESNGVVTVAASGGVTPYEYSLDGTTYQTAAEFGSLAADTYTVTVRDTNGCIGTVTATMEEPDVLDLSVSQTNRDFSITASGGTTPYEYSSNGTTFQSSSSFAGLDPGDYTFLVKDANGCTSSSEVFSIVLALDQVDLEIVVYPNPVTEYFIVESALVKEVEVYDVNGKKQKVQMSDARVDMSQLSKGMYVIKMKGEDGKIISVNRILKTN